METIVITGGPCSGKTSAMKVLRARLASENISAIFVDEAGTDLIMAGVSPATLGTMLPFQIRVAQLQLEREAAAQAEAHATAASFVICDRGIADGAAYLSESDYQALLETIGLSTQEIFNRYDAVFCLESTAKDAESLGAYTTHNNAARRETPEEAAQLDTRTRAAWEAHPQFRFIPNATSFEEKVAPLVSALLERGAN